MIRSIIVSAALLVGSQIAFAQPATDNAPIAANPANPAPAQPPTEEAMRKGQEAFQKAFAEMAKMAPEQQKEAVRKIQEQGLRLNFDRAGFKDPKLQDRIIAFVAEQEKSREKVRRAASKVYLALEPRGLPADKQGMTMLLDGYLNAVDDAKDERETATQALDKDINFTANPHLMALLNLNGIIGEASWFTSDVLLIGSMSIGSLAGLR